MGTQPQQPCREEEEDELQGHGATLSGQSMSTSQSIGSPSNRSEQAMATPSSEKTFLKLNIKKWDNYIYVPNKRLNFK